MSELDPQVARRAIVDHSRRLVQSALAAGPQADVPTAPEWTVAELVAHVGVSQHWTAEIIERRVGDPTQLPTEMAVPPVDPAEWEAWLSGSAQRLATACSDEALDDATVWNAAADARTGAEFWLTTALNEAVVHGVDAAVAAGQEPVIEADVAAALIGNQLRMLTSPTWEAQRPESAHALRGSGETLQWVATDAGLRAEGAAWLVVRRPDGATWASERQPADVTVSGPAAALFLVLTRRRPLVGPGADLAVDGDAALVEHWLHHSAHSAG